MISSALSGIITLLMNNEHAVNVLAKTLNRSSYSRGYYLAAKGLYRHPAWDADKPTEEIDLVVAVHNNTMVWTHMADPYVRADRDYVLGWLQPPYPPIICVWPYTELLPDTIELRTRVVKELRWEGDYSDAEAEEILRQDAEGFKNFIQNR